MTHVSSPNLHSQCILSFGGILKEVHEKDPMAYKRKQSSVLEVCSICISATPVPSLHAVWIVALFLDPAISLLYPATGSTLDKHIVKAMDSSSESATHLWGRADTRWHAYGLSGLSAFREVLVTKKPVTEKAGPILDRYKVIAMTVASPLYCSR